MKRRLAVAHQLDGPTQQLDGRTAGKAGHVRGEREHQRCFRSDLGGADPAGEQEGVAAVLAARGVQSHAQPRRGQVDQHLSLLQVRGAEFEHRLEV